jgi:apolipoprotein N-acyltransferase
MPQTIMIILSAILTGLAHQPLGLGWLAWFSLIPFIFGIQKICSFKDHLKLGFTWGFFYNLTIIFWIAQNLGTSLTIGIISMFSAVILFAMNTILIMLVFYFIKRRVGQFSYLLLPLIWVSIEYIRSFGALANPWISLANTQIDFLTLIQNAEYTGIYGISFWLVLLNLLGYEWYREKNKKSAFSWLVVFCLPWVTGLIIMPVPVTNIQDSIDVTIVQPNLHLSEKRQQGATPKNINNLLKLSFSDNYEKDRLVIWPETSTISYLLQNGGRYLNQIQRLLSITDSELLTGLPLYKADHEGKNLFYNSIAHIKADTVSNVYDKIHLVPMGEYIPLSAIFPSLKKLNLGQANFEHGNEYTIFEYKGHKLAGMVCLESTFPQLNRQFVKNGAEVLFYVVNDGWYETPPEPQQHARQTVFRAIEFRRPILRCANTGISQIVDASGNIRYQTQLNQSEVIRASVVPNSALTFYTKFGDVFAWVNILIIMVFLGRGKSKKYE